MVGPMNRKNIIHLNEHGYTRDGKKYTPRGFGVIAKTLAASERKYREIIKKELANKNEYIKHHKRNFII